MRRTELTTLTKLFREYDVDCEQLEEPLDRLVASGLVKIRSSDLSWERKQAQYASLTRKGRATLLDGYSMQVIDSLAKEHDNQDPSMYRSSSLRECIHQVINRLPVSELAELVIHKSPYIQKLAKARIVNVTLKSMNGQVDRNLARKLLALGDVVIEEALRGGLVPTIEDATVQWRKDLLCLDPEELVDRYMEVCWAYNSSFTKRVLLLRRSFKRLAEDFLRRAKPGRRGKS